MNTHERFKILHRDNFECQYCGARPGNDGLEVDHIIPRSFRGSDDRLNLTTACTKCNRGRTNMVMLPRRDYEVDNEGWRIIFQRGAWAIKACSHDVYVTGAIRSGNPKNASGEYNFNILRAHEGDWPHHISQKTWGAPHSWDDFMACLDMAKRLTNPPEPKVKQ